MKCPECGGKVYNEYHIDDDGLNPKYHHFWCVNHCKLTCGNCEYGKDTHGDLCQTVGCFNNSKWSAIKK